MYLTYEEYQAYGGTLDEAAFRDTEFDAESVINWYTFNRLSRPEWAFVLEGESLKRCVYQLIRIKVLENEMLAAGSGGVGWGVGWTKEAGVTQMSNDGVSVSYNTPSSGQLLDTFMSAKGVQNTVNRYLGGIVNGVGRSVLYRGIYPGE